MGGDITLSLCCPRCRWKEPQADRRAPIALMPTPSSNSWVAGATSQRLTNTCCLVPSVPSLVALRNTAQEMQEGALGGKAAEPAQQAGAGRQEYFPQED